MDKLMKKYFEAILVLVLFTATLVSLAFSQIDYVEPTVFFYLQHLPIVYHISVVASILVALHSKHKPTRLLSLCVVTLLLVWVPSLMFVQSWFLDSYPFVGEAVFISRNGHVGDFHYLLQNPGLGLAFGPYLLITGISPLVLLKIYYGFFGTLSVLFIYIIAKRLKLSERASILASLLFISVMWPNVFHLSRQSFSLISYFTSLFLVIWLILNGSDRRIVALLPFPIILMAMSHPLTPLFFIYNLAAIAVIGLVSRGISSHGVKLLSRVFLLSTVIWLLWNMIGTHPGVIYSIKEVSASVLRSITENPLEVSGVTTIFAGHTPVYSLLINARFLQTFFVYVVSFLVPILCWKLLKYRKTLSVLTGWSWSNMSIAIPILFAGLPYFYKPALFSIISWGPIAVLAIDQERFTKLGKIMYFILVAFIILSSLLIPLIKYPPLATEYSSTRELAGQTFLDLYSTGNTFFFSEDPAYTYSYILYGRSQTNYTILTSIYVPYEGINVGDIDGKPVWITTRFLIRDVFYDYTPSLAESAENLTRLLPETTHNKVYDSGWPESVFVPREPSFSP
jgi:hypothetical protein